MLNKDYLIKLNKERKFREIYSVFREEFIEMILLFFKNNNITPLDDTSLIKLTTQLQNIDKKYDYVSSLIIESFYSDEVTLSSALNNCFDIHEELKQALKT